MSACKVRTAFEQCQDYLLGLKDLADAYRDVPELAGPLTDCLYKVVGSTKRFIRESSKERYDELLGVMNEGLTLLGEKEQSMGDPMLSTALRMVIGNYGPVLVLLALDSERYVETIH